MAGRPRKPSALKLLHGDFDKNPQLKNRKEPQHDGKSPTCPRWISGEARKEWKRLASELASMKVISQTDRSSLEQYCVAYQQWRDSLKVIAAEGVMIDTPTGLREHPQGKIARECANLIHKMLAQFGMTPAARSRLQVNEETPPTRMRRVREG